MGNVRGKKSSDLPRLRGTHLGGLRLGRMVLGFLDESLMGLEEVMGLRVLRRV